jgi:hypothetical protein
MKEMLGTPERKLIDNKPRDNSIDMPFIVDTGRGETGRDRRENGQPKRGRRENREKDQPLIIDG